MTLTILIQSIRAHLRLSVAKNIRRFRIILPQMILPFLSLAHPLPTPHSPPSPIHPPHLGNLLIIFF